MSSDTLRRIWDDLIPFHTRQADDWQITHTTKPRSKHPVAQGTTGREGRPLTTSALIIARRRKLNPVIRIPTTVVGIDLDLYKGGAREALREAEREHGTLPDTLLSTAREDGSGIRLYRLPPEHVERIEGDFGRGHNPYVKQAWGEALHHRHRYVCQGFNPDAGAYYTMRWGWDDGLQAIDELEELPEAWVVHVAPLAERRPSRARSRSSSRTRTDEESGFALACAELRPISERLGGKRLRARDHGGARLVDFQHPDSNQRNARSYSIAREGQHDERVRFFSPNIQALRARYDDTGSSTYDRLDVELMCRGREATADNRTELMRELTRGHRSPRRRKKKKQAEEKIPRTIEGLVQAFARVGVQVRENVLNGAREITYDAECLPWEWEIFDELREASLVHKLNQEVRWANSSKIGMAAFRHLLLAYLDTRRMDPQLEWLKRLPAWDGTDRLSGLLQDLFGVAAGYEELAKWWPNSVLVGAVRRIRRPGAKHDEMTILMGKQSMGKTTFLRLLLPPGAREQWFQGDIDIGALRSGAGRKDLIESTLGRVIIESPELIGLANPGVARVFKGFLTVNNDIVRLPYARTASNIKRRWVMVGTSNEFGRAIPNDPSGNRRYVPIALQGKGTVAKVRTYLASNRDQLWAEAVHRHDSGVKTWLHSEELVRLAAGAAESQRQSDEWENALSSLEDEEIHYKTSDQIAEAAGLLPEGRKMNLREQQRLAQALEHTHERQRQYVNGRRRRVWVPKAEQLLPEEEDDKEPDQSEYF